MDNFEYPKVELERQANGSDTLDVDWEMLPAPVYSVRFRVRVDPGDSRLRLYEATMLAADQLRAFAEHLRAEVPQELLPRP